MCLVCFAIMEITSYNKYLAIRGVRMGGITRELLVTSGFRASSYYFLEYEPRCLT